MPRRRVKLTQIDSEENADVKLYSRKKEKPRLNLNYLNYFLIFCLFISVSLNCFLIKKCKKLEEIRKKNIKTINIREKKNEVWSNELFNSVS